jgi:hypothetical protein
MKSFFDRHQTSSRFLFKVLANVGLIGIVNQAKVQEQY